MNASYDSIARLYDSAFGAGRRGEDIDLYSALAGEAAGPVLEMGAGTGRVCITLAERGFHTTAVELSAEMLAIAVSKADAELTASARKNLHLIQGDMCAFGSDQSFSLILFPYSSLFECGTKERVRQALANAYRLLKTPGLMLIDCTYYGPGGYARKNGEVRELPKRDLPDARTVTLFRTDWHDETTGATECRIDAAISDALGVVVERSTHVIGRVYVGPEELRGMFDDAGFEACELYGAFDRTPIGDPSFQDAENQERYQKARQVWLCKKCKAQ